MIWWTGAIVGMAVAVLLLGAAIAGAVRLVVIEVDHIRAQGVAEGLRFSKQRMRSASWWFSEDEPTRNLLADLAELSEWDARDKWRKAREVAHGAR